MPKNNLMEIWTETATSCGESLTYALRDMSRLSGHYVSLSRFGEWRNGKLRLPDAIHRQMILECLPIILLDNGMDYPDPGDEEAYDRLVAALMPPIVE